MMSKRVERARRPKMKAKTRKSLKGGDIQSFLGDRSDALQNFLGEQFRDKVVGHSGYRRAIREGIKFFSSEEGKNFKIFLSNLGTKKFKNDTEFVSELVQWYLSKEGSASYKKLMKITSYTNNPAESFDNLLNNLVIPEIRNNNLNQGKPADNLIHKDLEAQIKIIQDYREKNLSFNLAMDADKPETTKHILTMLTHIARLVKHPEYKNVTRLTREYYERVHNTDDSIESTLEGAANGVNFAMRLGGPIMKSSVTKFTNDQLSNLTNMFGKNSPQKSSGGFRKSRKRKLRSKSKSLRKQNISYKRQQRKKTM